MKLVIINEVLPVKDAEVFLRLAQYWLPIIQNCKTGWNTVFDSVELVNDLGATKTYVEKSGEAPFYLTERKAIRGDAGYHDWNPTLQIPYAYCSLKNSRFVFGKFHYPLKVLAHKVGTLFIPTRYFGKFSILSQGLATSFIHEVFEAIGNPQLKNISGSVAGTTLDSKGRAIFMENADPVARTLFRWTDPVTKQDVAVTNFVYKSWYDKNATGQLDEAHACHAPFEVLRGGYLFAVVNGRYVKVA